MTRLSRTTKSGALALAVRIAVAAASGATVLTLAAAPAHAQRGGTREGEPILIIMGETKSIPTGGKVERYAQGDTGIIQINPTADMLVVKPLKPGRTSITLYKTDGSQVVFDITVAQRNPEQVKGEVAERIASIPGSLRVRVVGPQVMIEGNVPSEADRKRLEQITAAYSGQVDIASVTSGVASKTLVRLDFFFVQYEKTTGYNVGIAWPGSIGADAAGRSVFQSNYTYDFISKTSTSATASVVNQPLPRLDIAARYGWAKVIKQSSVITANGSEATFQNGGEQNFLSSVGLAVGLVNVRFGTNVTVLPRYDEKTRDVEIRLNADVADLTAPAVANGPPGRTTTKLDTQVTLKLGQALVLSGIRTATQRRQHVGIPGLSDVPVLGVLFGTHSQERQDVEGAVFIVPSVVDTVPKSALELINNAMSTYKEYSGEIDSVDTYSKQPPSAK
jgi:pilus assembly protein CpaC